MITFYSVNGAEYTIYLRRFVRFHFSPLDGAIFNASSLLAMCMKWDRALTEKHCHQRWWPSNNHNHERLRDFWHRGDMSKVNTVLKLALKTLCIHSRAPVSSDKCIVWRVALHSNKVLCKVLRQIFRRFYLNKSYNSISNCTKVFKTCLKYITYPLLHYHMICVILLDDKY